MNTLNDSDEDNDVNDKDFSSLIDSGMSLSTLAVLQEFLKGSSNHDEKSSATTGSHGSSSSVDIHNDSNFKFKERTYWEDRFNTEEQYDWLCTYNDVAASLCPLLNKDDHILVIGCGNSSFSADLYDAGYMNITNIDFSETVIHHMIEKHSDLRPHMKWDVMDMTNITFNKGSYDVVLDKAAMDALMVDEVDVWHPQQSVIDAVDRMCYSIINVLKHHGKYIQISFAQPHFRTKYLIGDRAIDSVTNFYSIDAGISQRYGWELYDTITIEKEAGCLNSFIYYMTKL